MELARKLHAAHEALRKPRRRRLFELLKDRQRDNLVLVMTLNKGHRDLLRNWIRSCDAHGIEVRPWTVVFPLDTETARLVEEEGFAVYCDPASYGDPPEQPARRFGDRTFVQLLFPKTAIVQDVMSLGYDVLFQDVDLVWRKDPLPYLLQPSLRDLDALFMHDGPHRIYAPLHANSGFFLLRNTPASRELWSLVFRNFDKMLHYRGQQRVVNLVLLNRFFQGLKLGILPEPDFPNGHLFTPTDASRLPEDPFVVHASWTDRREQKVEKLKNAGLWYL
ncbi:MAG: putative nucleotide-diphospho-sugar transferase [Myxococcota bacterium]|nr:putative nucleotide-diphospho-sugar transferase [Myxococcota bacterium]